MLSVSDDHGMIAVLKMASGRLSSGEFGPLQDALTHAVARGRSAVLVDLSAVRRITRSGLAALVEFHSEAPQGIALGYFAPGAAVLREFERCAVSRLLPIYSHMQEALSAPEFRMRRLAGVKAVVLVGEATPALGPLGNAQPAALLDLVGRPLVAHVMDHLADFGVRDFLLNPAHLGPMLHAEVQSCPRRSVQFLNEGHYVGGTWHATPLRPVQTLLNMQRRLTAFEADFLVVAGTCIRAIDYADMMDHHRRSGADITVAVSQGTGGDGESGLRTLSASTTPGDGRAAAQAFVVRPSLLRRLAQAEAAVQALDLLPAVLATGGQVQSYVVPELAPAIETENTYYRAVSRALRGLLRGVHPMGQEIRRHVWAAPGAEVSPRAVIVGPCFIGPKAKVAAGAKLEGPTVVLEEACAAERTLVRRAIVMPQTEIQAGTWVEDMVVAPEWAVDHRFAADERHTTEALEGVVRRSGTLGTSQLWPEDDDLAGGLSYARS